MKNKVQESGGSTGNKQGRSKLWTVARFCLIGLATLVTLFMLFHVEENWRGKRAWENYKQEMIAKGAVFQLEKLAPPSVPDNQNFAMTPLLRPVLDLNPPGTVDAEGNAQLWRDPAGKARAEAIKVDDPGNVDASSHLVDLPDQPEWRLGERFQLEGWQKYYAASKTFPSWPESRGAAEDVLKALSRFDAELAELKEAGKRPYSRFNVDYDNEDPISILLPHLSVLRNIARVAQLKAVAELHAGNVDTAFEDVNLLFTLTDSIKDEPVLISHLVRAALLNMTLQAIWEGMCDHNWRADQLTAFEKRLDRVDLLAELNLAMRAERAMGVETAERIARAPRNSLQALHAGTPAGNAEIIVMKLIPQGWWYLEALNYCRTFSDYVLPGLPENSASFDADPLKDSLGDYERILSVLSELQGRGPISGFFNHVIFSGMMLPALEKVPKRSIEAQVMCELTVVATQLERHHLANGTYPQSLSLLTAADRERLPNDPITHEPFKYEKFSEDSFRLWSVGWNEVDDGGTVLVEESEYGRSLERDQLDWVWPSAEGMRLEEQVK